MVEKVAVPFWLCFSVGLVIGLVTGNEALWMAIGAAVGLLLGFVLRARAIAKRRDVFHGKNTQIAAPAAVTTTPHHDMDMAA